MTSTVQFSRSLENIFKTPVLFSMFLICFFIVLMIVSYSRFYIIPIFSNLLVQNIEKDADRTVESLSAILFDTEPNQNINSLTIPGNDISIKEIKLKASLFTKSTVERIREVQFFLQFEKD